MELDKLYCFNVVTEFSLRNLDFEYFVFSTEILNGKTNWEELMLLNFGVGEDS